MMTQPTELSKLPGGLAMAAGQEAPVSEAQIAVHWREEEYYYPALSDVHFGGPGVP